MTLWLVFKKKMKKGNRRKSYREKQSHNKIAYMEMTAELQRF